DDVAGGGELTPERDQRLAGGDADPHGELELVADRERRTHGPLRIVLVRQRRSEQGQHRVARELLHRAPEALELGANALVVRPQQSIHVLGIERFGARREADEVAEEDRDDLALALWTGAHAPECTTTSGVRRRSRAAPSRRSAPGSAPGRAWRA